MPNTNLVEKREEQINHSSTSNTTESAYPLRACLFACFGCPNSNPEKGSIEKFKECALEKRFGYNTGIVIRKIGNVNVVGPVNKPLGLVPVNNPLFKDFFS